MNDGVSRPCLSALFVDYDNIYLSLKRKNEEAAKQFAKNAGMWLKAIESGALITPTNAPIIEPHRRIVLNRCYGNPVPRRSNKDNSTDMNSFPFVRHHFLRAGSEIIDCPPLTAQLKNSSDIRMVMDIRDLLNHDTYYDEFIILSGDADFTPVLHRLRAHARRTVIYANDYTAVPYKAISDGEIQEKDLINLLITGHVSTGSGVDAGADLTADDTETLRRRICDAIVVAVSESDTRVPIESLADRAQRSVGHEQTVGTNWVGHGNFLTFLVENLPDHIELTENAPYFAIDTRRMQKATVPDRVVEDVVKDLVEPTFDPAPVQAEIAPQPVPVSEPAPQAAFAVEPAPTAFSQPVIEEQRVPIARQMPGAPLGPQDGDVMPTSTEITAELPGAPVAPIPPAVPAPVTSMALGSPQMPTAGRSVVAPQAEPQAHGEVDATSAIQRSIARIHEACQAPPLAPPEYRMMFELIAQELQENNLNGQQTNLNIVARAHEVELEVKQDDVRFIVDVISEADPWFEQGASASLFAGRFRNFVVARCRGQGLKLTVDELDLIDAWFAGQTGARRSTDAPGAGGAPSSAAAPTSSHGQQVGTTVDQERGVAVQGSAAIDAGEPMSVDELPRIVRSRMRG